MRPLDFNLRSAAAAAVILDRTQREDGLSPWSPLAEEVWRAYLGAGGQLVWSRRPVFRMRDIVSQFLNDGRWYGVETRS